LLLAALEAFCFVVLPRVLPEQAGYGWLGAAVAALGILLWWAFFSRVPHKVRWGLLLLAGAAIFLTSRVLDPSIAGAGQGMLFYIFSVMLLTFVLPIAVALTRRRAVWIATVLVAIGGWALLRTEGVSGGAGSQLRWRWTPTPEERLLAQVGKEPPIPAPAANGSVAETAPEWPGFRGPNRDDVVRGVRIETDWASTPPSELWRRPVGPGWGSFAVHGDRIYTQEQRGESELVSCYSRSTGKPVWEHRDAARFYESNGGAGPRGTPTLADGHVYSLGATGILNALDEATGAVVWSRNTVADVEAKVPYWGICSSPLVVGDRVIVAVSGRLAAYDAATGEPRWQGPSKFGGSYSSPQLVTLDGVPQVVLLSGKGATSVAPDDGKLLWQHEWEGAIMLQPATTEDGDLLITACDMSGGVGTRRLKVTQGTSGWTVEERWTTRGLKPYFNDFVVHRGHAYGFDGSILACIDLNDGQRKWKGGRYGNGQLVLLPDSDLLLVLSEDGEIALVSATPDQFKEIARLPALEGKTWNHPVVAGDTLLVRNGQEMAAFRLRTPKDGLAARH
jgi:outer membrane protein assembly factor BamB